MSGRSARPHPDRVVAGLIAGQHDVLEHRQLLAAGLTDDQIHHRLAIGRLFARHRGVSSVVPTAHLRPEGRCLAAVLALGEGAVLSHSSAAALWGIRPDLGTKIHVTVPTYDGRKERDEIKVRRSTTLVDEDRVLVSGIPVTSVARTLIDLADRLGPAALARAIGQAEDLRVFDLHELEAAMARARGRRGPRRLRAALALLEGGTPVPESGNEDRLLTIVARHGLPAPEPQARIGRWRVDCLWEDARLVAEADGREWHTSPSARDRDNRRDRDPQRLGYRVARFTDVELWRDPAGVAAALGALLAVKPGTDDTPAA